MAEVNMDNLSINGIKPTQVIKDDNEFKIRFLDLPIDNSQLFFEGMTADKSVIESDDDNPFVLSNVNINMNFFGTNDKY